MIFNVNSKTLPTLIKSVFVAYEIYRYIIWFYHCRTHCRYRHNTFVTAYGYFLNLSSQSSDRKKKILPIMSVL